MDSLVVDVTLREGLRDPLPRDISATFTLEAGEHRIVGPSGSGKSTLLAAIAGVVRLAAGSLRLGQELYADTEAGIHVAPEKRRAGWVPQGGALFPHFSTEENLRFGARPGKMQFAAIVDALELGPVLARNAASLSGGEAARASLARALLTQPRLLLLDEAFAPLDRTLRRRVRAFVTECVRTLGIVALSVEHEPDEPDACAALRVTYDNIRHTFRELDVP